MQEINLRILKALVKDRTSQEVRSLFDAHWVPDVVTQQFMLAPTRVPLYWLVKLAEILDSEEAFVDLRLELEKARADQAKKKAAPSPG